MKFVELEATPVLLHNLKRATYSLIESPNGCFCGYTDTIFLVKDVCLWQHIIAHPTFSWHSTVYSDAVYNGYNPILKSGSGEIPWNRRAFNGNNFVFYVGEKK